MITNMIIYTLFIVPKAVPKAVPKITKNSWD
jgi:hypothetical protein